MDEEKGMNCFSNLVVIVLVALLIVAMFLAKREQREAGHRLLDRARQNMIDDFNRSQK